MHWNGLQLSPVRCDVGIISNLRLSPFIHANRTPICPAYRGTYIKWSSSPSI